MTRSSTTRDPEPAAVRDREDTERALPPGPGPAVARESEGDVAAGAPAVAPDAAVARPHRGGAFVAERPETPEEMREEIEATRARMSQTLDQIEDRLVHEKEELVRKKEELWARATLRDFRRTVSSEPWRSVVLALVAGYLVAAVRD